VIKPLLQHLRAQRGESKFCWRVA